MSDEQPKRAATGRPFTKDDPRINRLGRPKGFAAEIRARYGRNTEGLLDKMEAIINGEEKGEQAVVVKEGFDSHVEIVQVGPSVKEKTEAAKFLIDHANGKPVQSIHVRNDDAGDAPQYDWSLLTDQELAELNRLLKKASPRQPEVLDVEVLEETSAAEPLALSPHQDEEG